MSSPGSPSQSHPDTPSAEQTKPADQQPTTAEGAPAEGKPGEGKPAEGEQTFDLAYVQRLRDEAAGHRVKAQDRDDLAHRLHTALVAQTGRLADPTDLPFSEDHLTDGAKLNAAIDALLTAKPHMAARRPAGDVGQGARSEADDVGLAGILRANAG